MTVPTHRLGSYAGLTAEERATKRREQRDFILARAEEDIARARRSIKCGRDGAHAGRPGGCSNDGSDCLCACHDYPQLPVGTPVRYWSGSRQGDGEASRTCSTVQLLGGHLPVVWVEGVTGAIAMSHIEPGEPADA